MDKKNRYSFKKVCFWVILVNGICLGLILWMMYYVKTPYQNFDMNQFSLARFAFRSAVAIVFQCIFDFFALNKFYRLLAQKEEWSSYLLWTIIFFLAGIVYYMLNDLTIDAPAVAISTKRANAAPQERRTAFIQSKNGSDWPSPTGRCCM